MTNPNKDLSRKTEDKNNLVDLSIDENILLIKVKQSLYTPWRRLGGEEV
jgi:hypothetical protein